MQLEGHVDKFRIVGIGNYYYGKNFQKFYRSKTGTILLQVEISILQFSNFHRYKIFLNFAIIHFESFSDTKKIGRHFAIPREGIEECRGPLFAYKEEGRKTYSTPFCLLLYVNTNAIFCKSTRKYIFLPWNTSSWKVFTKKNTSILPLSKRVCIYVCVNTTRYSTIPLHLSRPDKERILRVFSHLYK